MDEWRKVNFADTDIQLDWWDCTAGIKCACSPHELLVLSDEGETKCDTCGQKYRMVTYLEVQGVPSGVSTEGAAWALDEVQL